MTGSAQNCDCAACRPKGEVHSIDSREGAAFLLAVVLPGK